jgi:hypothetical protein
VQSSPFLACLIIIAVFVGVGGIILFFYNMIRNHHRSWLISLGQTVPLTAAIFFYDFVLTYLGNYALLVIFFVIVIFLILAVNLQTYGKSVIITMGLIGIFLWIGLFCQFYGGISIEQLPPPQQFPPPLPPGRP